MGYKTEKKRAPRRWRKRKEGRHKRGLVVDDLEYIWRKKIEALRVRWWRLHSCKGNDCPLAVRLYAKLGLHRYNMLQLLEIEKYNRDNNRVMDVVCHIARPKDTATNGTSHPTENFDYDINKVPDWPLNKAFADNNRFFYKMQESEWAENDWIRLYLELAFVTTNPLLQPNLSDLNILNVVLETEENVKPLNERLKCLSNAIVYIRYDQDLGEDRVCKCRAIVRRSMDLISKRFCLVGKIMPVPNSE
ncbi:UPF0725 protein At1g19060-like [Eutrema salsugineum]|uniref:UPF0725 protein At1g19060-like n=1 Tax=Eutrema salsugineum TaxID=72664 RepID=UPI000CED0976|nr:UPF0725 protein At1g19060-like [Eutrema salsugineum]